MNPLTTATKNLYAYPSSEVRRRKIGTTAEPQSFQALDETLRFPDRDPSSVDRTARSQCVNAAGMLS